MRAAQKVAAIVLGVGLGASIYGIVRSGVSAAAATKNAKKAAAADVVDQTPSQTARQLAQLADTAEEQALAKEALRLGDYELDLAFDIALRDADAHPPDLSEEAKAIEARLETAQKLRQSLQKQVDQLTVEIAKASSDKKAELDDQLSLTKSSLDLANNEVEDAENDLTDAGGNQRGRIARLKQAHEDAEHAKGTEQKFPQAAPPQFGIIHHFQAWSVLRQKMSSLAKAKAGADLAAAGAAEQHNALEAQIEAEKFNSPDLAVHSTLGGATSGGSAAESVAQSVRRSRSHEESRAALAATKMIADDQHNLSSLDKRGSNEKELSETYARWMELVSARQGEELRRLLMGVAVILVVLLVAIFFDTWLSKILGTLKLDRRQIQTLRAVTQVTLQVFAVLFVLLVIIGPPGQLGTFIGLATAGLTVALKDFIVGFVGWFVLMGKNGIRLGDWVEINGVTGEVVEIGMFHTVLLETGNWTDSGHPTGRRVTFTNSYAIEGHYFNFSTSGQWLWDELQVVLPSGEDPYPIIEAIQKRVLAATEESAKSAAQEWKSTAGNRDIGSFSAEPSINLKPVLGGVELSVRYITQANQRYQLRTKPNQAAVELLGKRGIPPASPAPSAAD